MQALRPAEWVTMVPFHSWVVDFRYVSLEKPVMMELMMARMVRPLIETAVPVWDACEGKGMLGLTGLGEHFVHTKKNRQLIKEVQDFSQWVLCKAARERSWQAAPRVLLLDL